MPNRRIGVFAQILIEIRDELNEIKNELKEIKNEIEDLNNRTENIESFLAGRFGYNKNSNY